MMATTGIMIHLSAPTSTSGRVKHQMLKNLPIYIYIYILSCRHRGTYCICIYIIYVHYVITYCACKSHALCGNKHLLAWFE
jgi:hypothetical protein